MKDLTQLVDEGYFLNFFVRSTASDLRFDVRFLDTDTGDTDHAWRRRHAIELNPEDSQTWHKVTIPLADFAEQGAWEDGVWYDPVGAFQWENVDRFEFSTEYRDFAEDAIWIDQVIITNRDTAQITTSSLLPQAKSREITAFPNPCNDTLFV